MLVVQDLGADGTSYVKEYLAANVGFGKQLGKLPLDRFDVAQGSAWALVPDPVPKDRKAAITEFGAGGLFRRHGVEWREKVNAWVSQQVGAEPHLLCAEHALSSPSDPFVAKLDGWHFFSHESVFDCVGSPTDEDVSGRFRGALWDPDVTILTPRPPTPPEDRSSVPVAALTALVDRSVAVGVGAWDDEGAVFWEPDRSG